MLATINQPSPPASVSNLVMEESSVCFSFVGCHGEPDGSAPLTGSNVYCHVQVFGIIPRDVVVLLLSQWPISPCNEEQHFTTRRAENNSTHDINYFNSCSKYCQSCRSQRLKCPHILESLTCSRPETPTLQTKTLKCIVFKR